MRRSLNLCQPLALTFVILLLAALSGCSSNGNDTLNRSLVAYDSGRFDESFQLAQEANGEASSTRDSLEASYIAGMSAFRLGRYEESVRWLQDPARAEDRWMAGQSNVTLGSSLLKLGRKSEAARAFVKAGEFLTGEDALKARMAAGNTFRELGDRKASDEQFRLANVTPPSSGTPPVAQGPSGSGSKPGIASPATGTVESQRGPFVLQAGAFKDREKAQRRADEVRATSTKAGLGEPRVLPKRATDGATMYVVQFGSFTDRRTAENALGRIGLSGVVVGRPVA
ncbi:MAG: SPOR domain-containing protein [Phycisphaerae bacterium]|jgi:tetratricopeptide (TPR) repeat protein|nr:SPOR domain-containing protein [Phycisphaerae bacterium]